MVLNTSPRNSIKQGEENKLQSDNCFLGFEVENAVIKPIHNRLITMVIKENTACYHQRISMHCEETEIIDH